MKVENTHPEMDQRHLWRILDLVDVGLLITDASRRILYVNSTFTRECGYTLDEMRGRSCAVLQGPGTDPRDVQVMREALNCGEGFSRVVLNYRKDGGVLHYRVKVNPVYDNGELQYFVGVQEDYTETYEVLQRLERWAYVDSLTGLRNRRAFDKAIEEAIEDGRHVQLVLLDLNDFKTVNDQQGHQAGDALLVAVGEALTTTFQQRGLVFRLGGDEFAVLLPGDEVSAVERTHDALEILNGGNLRVAVGSACAPDETQTVAELFRLADARMYVRKSSYAR
ncbi:diguanylate cyclase [Deinococcus sp. 6YEL10]|uniref:GGDEF domain-containing protein n=1 Tax=Deinococcus sp. 6YEL10 TaxID=2745870 RepID=UPI001E4598C5|nr:GGDEF domain-containing protein [Deinococcus sp. 6YEL10]MCD0160369.1 diguanylate cyclase [Deinococcus sp. 6YEL10]